MTSQPTTPATPPTQLDEILAAVRENTATVAQAMETVAAERRGRKLSMRLLSAAVVLILVVGAGRLADYRAQRKTDCANRVISRQEVRNYGEALVDGISDPPLFQLTEDQKTDLLDVAETVGREELPATPLGC